MDSDGSLLPGLKISHPSEQNAPGRKGVCAFLAALIAFLGIHNHFWLRAHWPFPTYPWYAGYFEPVIHFHAFLKAGSLLGAVKWIFQTENADVYAFTAGILSLVDRSQQFIVLMNNLPYLAVAVVFVYKLGEMVSDRRGGLLAATLFGLYPSVYGMSRHYSEEFAVMCVSVFAVWSLLKADGFRNRAYSIWFGVAFGWGMLIKYVFFAYMFGPMLVAAVGFWRRRKALSGAQGVNLALSAVAALAMMGPKYINPVLLRGYIARPLVSPALEPWNAVVNLEATVFSGIVYHLALPFFMLWLVCCVLFWRGVESHLKWSFLLWIFVPWTAVTFMRHERNPFYLIHFTAPMAVMSAHGVLRLAGRSRKALGAALLCILAVGLPQFYDFSFGTRLRLHEIAWARMEGRALLYYRPSDGICHPPGKDPEIMRKLERLKNLCGDGLVIALLHHDSPWVEPAWVNALWFHQIPFGQLNASADVYNLDFSLFEKADWLLWVATPSLKEPESWLWDAMQTEGEVLRRHTAQPQPYGVTAEGYYEFISRDYQKLRAKFREGLSSFVPAAAIPFWPDVSADIYKRRGS